MSKKILFPTSGILSKIADPAGFFRKKKGPPAPNTGPIIMPLADDQAVAAARKKSIAAQMKRGGRSSTILTDTSGSTLGN